MEPGTHIRASSAAEVADIVTEAARAGARLDIRGGGTKAAFGAPTPQAAILDLSALSEIVDYDPDELVLTVGAGARLADVEALLASRGQMLAFEPFDHGPIYGASAGASTIGGVVAAGVSGSRRLSAGAVRDHLLGFKAVSGRGEAFVAGARVVKNVTGYDLPKLMAGSWGRLAALTEVTLKVLPRGRSSATVLIDGLDVTGAQRAMARALASPAEVSAAAYRPANNGAPARTALRLEGFDPSVTARAAMLIDLFAPDLRPFIAPQMEADAFWRALRTLSPLAGEGALWRVNIPPSGCDALIEALEPLGPRYMIDWAGGLVWLQLDGHAATIRQAACERGGHAALIRAPAQVRAQTAALHPPAPGVAALEARVRASFDPAGVFDTGRFFAQIRGADAD